MGVTDKSQALTKTETKPLSDQHRLIAYWAAHGIEPKEIAIELGYSEKTIKSILKEKQVQFFIRKTQHKIYGEDPALHIKICASKGIKVAEDIMESKKTKDHTRQEIAFKFMDRAYGKPGIEDGLVEGTVRKILQMLQKPVDLPTQEIKNDIEDAEYTELPMDQNKTQEEPKEVDKVDDWIDKNIK